MKKIFLALIALVSLGALSWLSGMNGNNNPKEEVEITFSDTDNTQAIKIDRNLATQIPLLKDLLGDLSTNVVPLSNTPA